MITKSAKAGAMQAGQPIADGALPDLLAFDTTEAGVRVGDMLRERLAAAERAAAAHATRAADAQLAGDETERAHTDEAARLQREVARLHLAIERADVRLAEVANAERQADARSTLAAATKAAVRAEAIVGTAYPAAARNVAALLGELRELQAEIIAARRAADDAGIGDEAAALVLPHEIRSRSAEFEYVEVENIDESPRVINSAGDPVHAGGARHWGAEPERAATVTRRREMRLVRDAVHAPNLATAAVLLPDPEGDRAFIVRQVES